MINFNDFTLIFVGRGGGGQPANNFFAIACLVAIILAVLFLFLRENASKSWEKGEIPSKFKNTPENLFELYVAAGSAMIARDRGRSKNKYLMLNNYLAKHFPEQMYNIYDSYIFSIQHVLKVDSLSKWANGNLNRDQKIQLCNFLASIAIFDGELSDQEKQHIHLFMQNTHLEFSVLEQEFQDIWIGKQDVQPVRKNSRLAYQILELDENATLDDVKKSYRRLVKDCHPDKYANESEQIQNQMKIKFQEIQMAYESIIDKFNS